MFEYKWPIINSSTKKKKKREIFVLIHVHVVHIYAVDVHIAAFAYTWYRLVFGWSSQNACKTRNLKQ